MTLGAQIRVDASIFCDVCGSVRAGSKVLVFLYGSEVFLKIGSICDDASEHDWQLT